MFRKLIDKYFLSRKLNKFYKKYLDNKNHSKEETNILVEFNGFASMHIYFALIAKFLTNNKKKKIKGFSNSILNIRKFNQSYFSKLKFNIANFLGVNFFGIYKSLGVETILCPIFSHEIKNKAKDIFFDIYKNINSKESIYNIKFDDVVYGDLIADGYLKDNFVYLIDFKSDKFKKYLFDTVCLYLYWKDYYKKNKVNYIFGVHAVYGYGIALRIALFNNVDVFTIISGKIHRLRKNRFYQNNEFNDYKEKFHNLNKEMKIKAYETADKVLIKKFNGEKNIKELWPLVPSFSGEKNNPSKILRQNSKLKILVATHNVKDSINCFGPTFFPDFYEWLNFLSEISKKTDYEWYVKDHPFYGKRYHESFGGDNTKELSKLITDNNENFYYIPASTPNNKIINEKIDFVLTIYGSVAFEYAYFGIPVLTASNCCPTINYDFNIHSKNLSEYKKNLLNLKNLKKSIDKNEIIQYYFMRYIYNNFDCFNEEHSNFLSHDNTYDEYDSHKFYKYLLQSLNKEKIDNMEMIFKNFFESSDYHLNSLHCDTELNKIMKLKI